MSKAKKVATTLKNVLENEHYRAIINKSADIKSTIETIDEWWKKDIYSRKPSAADYNDDGSLNPTDLDLSTVLYTLTGRGAVIIIPKYETVRNNAIKEGDIIVSKDNRHGELTSLVSNQNTFNFSVRIKDYNVISDGKVGAPRTFLITDENGEWYPGWSNLQFQPSEEEKKYIAENNINFEDRLVFKNFVTPEKWISFYGYKYWVTKVAIDRLVDELAFIKSEIKNCSKFIVQDNIGYPSSDFKSQILNEAEPVEKVKVVNEKKTITAFEVEIDHSGFIGCYDAPEVTENSSKEFVKQYVNNLEKDEKYYRATIEKFRYITRCIEYAVFKKNPLEHFPAWLVNCKWETGFKFPKKKIEWNRLIFGQDKVGEYGYGIRFRTKQTVIDVKKKD